MVPNFGSGESESQGREEMKMLVLIKMTRLNLADLVYMCQDIIQNK